jgi:hypothetical protein
MADDIPVEVDHVFVSASVGAPEGDRLIELGLVEGSANRHPGQGTANRRFFFANAMLELIWVHDPVEAQSAAAARTSFASMGALVGSRRLGVSVRRVLAATAGTSDVAPFPAWEYRPSYAPTGMPDRDQLHRGLRTAGVLHPDPSPHGHCSRGSARAYEHALPIRELTSARIFAPGAATASPAMLATLQTGAFSFEPAARPAAGTRVRQQASRWARGFAAGAATRAALVSSRPCLRRFHGRRKACRRIAFSPVPMTLLSAIA